MARLIYGAITSVDGYVTDTAGEFGWAAPDEEVHAFVNDCERETGTYLYGRRMYDVMRYWAAPDPDGDASPAVADYRQIWQRADKIVYSTTLQAATTPQTTVRRSFDVDAVRALKESADRDLSIGGPTLAAAALRAGLVDVLHLFVVPVVVGGGTPALPAGLRQQLTLLTIDRFDSGFVHLHYAVSR